MNDNQTIKEIYRSVGNLDGKVDGINQRLDTMNGSIALNVKDINDLQKSRDTSKGKTKGVAIVSGLVGLVIGALTIAGIFVSYLK